MLPVYMGVVETACAGSCVSLAGHVSLTCLYHRHQGSRQTQADIGLSQVNLAVTCCKGSLMRKRKKSYPLALGVTNVCVGAMD